MLIHGGTISSGLLYWSGVVGSYWISWNSSFWKITLPGVVATFLPISKAEVSVMRDAQLAVAALDVVQQVVEALDQVLAVALDGFAEDFRVGQREIGRRQGVDVLAA